MPVRDFINHHYRHFNAATLKDAADAYVQHVDDGGLMLLAMAGAMSTAELGLSLAEMIRRDKVHAICCTGANLEEDLFNLVAHEHYVRIPDWRSLTPQREKELELQGLNRVTDTCIPEEAAFRRVERVVLDLWCAAEAEGKRYFPHEYLYQLIQQDLVAESYQIDPRDSWLVAAAEKSIPMFVPGWEDSTLGNVFVANVIQGTLQGYHSMRSGLEYMAALADWYVQQTTGHDLSELPEIDASSSKAEQTAQAQQAVEAVGSVGFFQIGGGIAGDFPICAVPMIHQDLRRPCPYWGYFCQISDSTTSYGSYSGAIPSEKITWGKLDVDTPQFVIESDATIVAPLIFAHILGW